ncbi:MAG: DUF3180 domain-containing protein [Propionibacteriaceae bacterium]|jgi:hypothetical protein|nr:DUF3180 domain-containing protein [Propionibacteriaceae bacterium]
MSRPLKPLRWPSLLSAAAFGGAIGWSSLMVLEAFGYRPAPPSWLVAGLLAGVALFGLAAARLAHQRYHVQHRYPDPSRAVALLALARASALAGAALAAAYVVLALVNLPRYALEASHQRVLRGAVCALAALLVMVAGLVLERECRSRHDDSSTDADAD